MQKKIGKGKEFDVSLHCQSQKDRLHCASSHREVKVGTNK